MIFRLPRLALPLLLAALLSPLAAAAQQAGPYVDPALRRVIRLQAQQSAAAGARFDVAGTGAPLSTPGRVAMDQDARGRTRVSVFLAVSDRGAIDALRARGVQVGTVVQAPDGRWLLTARIPLDMADSVLSTRGLLSAYASRTIKVQNDSGMKAIHADQVRQRSGGVWTGQAGQGVIVGVYDTGLDFTHPDFIDPSGHTRVLGVWDQTQTGSGPGAGFSYGIYCSSAAVQATIAGTAGGCSMKDVHGHGTHVAGTAAGNGGTSGAASENVYAGVAPAADLLIVKGGNGNFQDSQIVDGIAWIDSMSVRLNKPAVVNLSLGGQGGPHDGTDPAEVMLDAMARRGFVVVVAAGNDGANHNTSDPSAPYYFHASRTVSAGQSASVSLTLPTYTPNAGTCKNGQIVSVWYAGSDALDLTVTRPDGSTVTAAAGKLQEGDGPAGDVYIDNASGGRDPQNQDNHADVELTDCGPSGARPAAGTWTLQLTGRTMTSGKAVHIWLDYGNLGGAVASGADGFDNRFVVGSPGTARSVITVAAFTTKNSWATASTGVRGWLYPATIGDLAPFSSGGPTRDGRMKPEIAAPGMGIMSALSKDEPSANVNPALLGPDSRHQVMAGTSMATPHVTGSVALLLQAKPNLSPDEVRVILQGSAGKDAFTTRTYGAGGAPSDWWGAGKVNVLAAISSLNVDPRAVASVALSLHVDTIPRGATEKLSARVYNAVGGALDSTVVWSSSNPAAATVDASGLVHAQSLGVAWIVAAAGGKRDSASFAVVPPAQLALTSGSASPAKATLSVKGARLPLLALTLKVSGYEAMRVTSLGFDVTGNDPGARLVLFRDLDGSGTIGSNEPQIATLTTPLAGTSRRVSIPIDSLSVPAGASASLILAVEMSGQAPNGSSFTATAAPAATHTLGVRSAAADQLGTPGATVASAPALTTVLGANENFVLSENPVRSGHVIFNFSKTPTVAAVYSLTGRRVVDLLPRLDNGGRVDWKLTNDDGALVAPGIYLVVFNIDGQLVRRKLFIVNSASVAGASQE